MSATRAQAAAALTGDAPAGGASRFSALPRKLVSAVKAEPWIAALVVATTVVNAAYAVIRHDHFGSGFDLGIFTQAIWHYSHFQAPGSSIKGIGNLLGDHFHPILVLLAPLFWIWSDPRALLIAQAALVGASIVPVYLFARPRLGRPAAHLLALAYASYWGLQGGIAYEFHEVAFAPLLIALAILFIDRRRWTAYFVTVGLLLCVKEDLSLLVCFMGIYLMTLREVRRGLITVAAGIAWYLLATKVFIPHFSGGLGYTYWRYPAFGHDLGDAVVHVVRAPWKPFEVAFDHSIKAKTMLYLLLPFLGLTLCSRLGLLAVPLLAERFLSATSGFWTTSFHYSMAIAPVLAMGAAAGLGNVARLTGQQLQRRLAVAGAAAMVVAGGLVSWYAIPNAPMQQMTERDFYRAPAYSGPVHRALDHLPAHAAVVAPDFLVPHLATRERTYDIAPNIGDPGYMITGLVQRVGSNGFAPGTTYHQYQEGVAKRLLLYEPVFYEDGWIVLRLRPHGINSGTNGVLAPMPRAVGNRLARVNLLWGVALVQAQGQLARCTQRLQAHGPATTACFETSGLSLLKIQTAIDPQLAALIPRLTGGCRQLGTLARAGAAQTVADISRLRTTGAHGSITSYYRAGSTYTADLNDLDLAGRINRFLLLCYPRPLPRR